MLKRSALLSVGRLLAYLVKEECSVILTFLNRVESWAHERDIKQKDIADIYLWPH